LTGAYEGDAPDRSAGYTHRAGFEIRRGKIEIKKSGGQTMIAQKKYFGGVKLDQKRCGIHSTEERPSNYRGQL